MKLNHNIPNDEISVSAFYVWNENHPYEALCWYLAERQLYVENNFKIPRKEHIQGRSYYIYDNHPPYDVLCWLIGELNLFIKRNTSNRTFDTLFSE
ncbi:MAG: hypothetical protein ACQERB_05240 [Promethearchaeati archaeon]